MKTILWRLFPGAAALAALLLGIGWASAQAPASDKGQVTSDQPRAANADAGAARADPSSQGSAATPQVIVCGECGAQLAAPQAVYVAAPIGGRGVAYQNAFVVGSRGEYVFLGGDGVRYWTDGNQVQPWRPAAPPMGGGLAVQPAFYGMGPANWGYPPPSQFRPAAPHNHGRNSR